MRRTARDRPARGSLGTLTSPPGTWSWKTDGRNGLIRFLVGLAAFANSLGNGFVYDDVEVIQSNPRLNAVWDVGTFFGTSYWADDSAKSRSALYRPLTIMSFAVDRALFGPGPFGVHLMNVLANALVAAVVYVFLFRLLARRDIAFVTALLYGLHPVHTEVVANGVGRADLYAVGCALVALLLHLEYARRGSYGWLVGALALYFVSLLFKEATVALPAVVFLMEWLILEGGRFGAAARRFGRIALYGVPLLAYLALRFSVVGAGMPWAPAIISGASAAQRVAYAGETTLRYVGQLIFPWHLCADYRDYLNPPRPGVTDAVVLLSLLHWATFAVLIRWVFKKGQYVLPVLGVAAFYVSVLPVSNLLFPIGTIRADRLLF